MFTRTKHRADRLAKHLEHHRSERAAHSRQPVAVAAHRCAGRVQERQVSRARRDRYRGARHRRDARSGTSSTSTCRRVPEDYIHRVGRTARAELTGSAFTLVAPEDEGSIRDIERAINKRLPRVTVPDFDYTRASGAATRGAARAAHRGDSRAQGRGTAARESERRAARETWPRATVGARSRPGTTAGATPGQGDRPAGPRPHGGAAKRFRPRTGEASLNW